MKNLFKTILLSVLGIYMMTSCGGDKNPPEKFSSMSVEENKAIVEDTGIDFIGILDRMRDTKTVDALGNLIDITESGKSAGISEFRNTGLYNLLKVYLEVSAGSKQVNDIFSSIIDLKSEDPESLQEFWNENVGTYTWNQTLVDWDIDLGGDMFIFLFPSSDASNTNDATCTIYNYDGVVISNPIDEEYTGDLPVGVLADLKVGTNTLVSFVFSASYNNDGIPNAMAAELDIEGFKFEVDVTNNSSLITATYKMWENNDQIMKLNAAVSGLFTDENIDDNTVHHSEPYTYVCDYVWNENYQDWVEVYCDDVDEWDEVEFEEIANSANAEFQIMDIALRGDINVKGLVDQVRIIEDKYDDEQLDEEEYCDQIAAELNKYLNMRLVNLTNNEIMAKAEAYVVYEQDYDWDNYYVSFRLTFGDGSPIDMETYFEEGFDDFVNSLNDLLQDVASDYDIDFDPIEY